MNKIGPHKSCKYYGDCNLDWQWSLVANKNWNQQGWHEDKVGEEHETPHNHTIFI